MAKILTTAFIAVTALALPNPTNSLLPRDDDFPQPIGVATGSPFYKLEFTVYAQEDCKGTPAGIFDGSYGFYAARQMQSYRLSRTLYHGQEELAFFAGPLPGLLELNHTVDHALNGHYTTSCLEYDFLVDLNGELKGCHTLPNNQWCAVISRTGNGPDQYMGFHS